MQQSKQFELFEEPLYSQLRYDLPLHDLINYSQKISKTLQLNIEHKTKLKNVIVLAAVESPEELKDQPWIEYLTDMTQLSQSQIEELMIMHIEDKYKERDFHMIQGFFQPTLQELTKQVSQSLQNSMGQKYLVHYVGRHQLLQEDDAIVLSQDEQSKFPIAVSITQIIKLFPEQTVYIFDCNYSGLLIQTLQSTLSQGAVAFASCKSNQQLPYMQQNKLVTIPTDIFSMTMLNPLLGLFVAYIHRSKQHLKLKTFQAVHNLYIQKIESNQNTYQELSVTLKQITETIAWQSVPEQQYYMICKHDKQLAIIVNNYFACERVMSIFGCTCCSTLELPDQSHNYLWSQLDQFFTQLVYDDTPIGYYQKMLKSQTMLNYQTGYTSFKKYENKLDEESSIQHIYSVYNLTELEDKEEYHVGNQLVEDDEPIFQFSRDQIKSFELQLAHPRLVTPQNIPVMVFQISTGKNLAVCVKLLLQLVDRDPEQCKPLGEIGLVVQLYKYIYLNRIDFLSHTKVNEQNTIEEISIIFQLLNKMFSYDISNIQHYKIVRTANQVTDKEFLSKILVNVIVNNNCNENNIKVTCLFHFMLLTCPAAEEIYAKYLCHGKDQTNLVHTIINYGIKHQNIIQLLSNISKLSNNNLLILISIQTLGNIMPYYALHLGQQRSMSQMSSAAQMRRSARLNNQQQDQGLNIHMQLLKLYNDENGFSIIQNEIQYVLKQIKEKSQLHGVEIRMALIYCVQQLIPIAVRCQGLYKYDENLFDQKDQQLQTDQSIRNISTLLESKNNIILNSLQTESEKTEIVQENLAHFPFDAQILEQFIEIFQNEINVQVRYELFVIMSRIIILFYQDVILTFKQQMLEYYQQTLDKKQYTQLFHRLKFEYNENNFKNGQILMKMVHLARYDNNAIINQFADRLYKNIHADAFVQLLLKMRFDKKQFLQNQEFFQQYMNDEEKQQVQNGTDIFNSEQLIQLITLFQSIEDKITLEIQQKVYNILQNIDHCDEPQEEMSFLIESLNSPFTYEPTFESQDLSSVTVEYSTNDPVTYGSRESLTQNLDSKVHSSMLLPTFEYSMPNLLNQESNPMLIQQQSDILNEMEYIETKGFQFNSKFEEYRYKYIIYQFKILKESHRDIKLLKDHLYYASNLHILNSLQSTVINMMFNAYLHQHQDKNIQQLAQKQAQLTHCKVNGCFYHNMIRINDPGASCGAHMDGIYCINCDKASQQAAHLAQRFLHVNPSSCCNSMSYDKKLDVFTRYRKFDVGQNITRLDSLASLIKKAIPKSKQSDTLQKYIIAMEQELQVPQQEENDSTNMEKQYIIRYGYETEQNVKGSASNLSFVLFMDGVENIIMTHNQLDNLIQRFILKNFVRAISQTNFCQQMMCGYPVHDNSQIVLNDVVLHITQKPTQEQINFSRDTRNNYNTLNPIGIYKQQQFVGQYIENLFNDGELYRVFQQSPNNPQILQQIQNIYESPAMKPNKPILNKYPIKNVFQQLNHQCQFCKNLSVRKPLIQLIKEPNDTLVYEPTTEYDPFPFTEEQENLYNSNNINSTEEEYDIYNNYVDQLIKNVASPIPLLDQKLTCGSPECKYLPRSIYRLCHKNEDLLLKFNKSVPNPDTEEMQKYFQEYKDKQQKSEQAFQSLDIDKLDMVNTSFGGDTTNNQSTCFSRSFDRLQQNMASQVYLQEQLSYLQYMYEKSVTPPVYSDKEIKLLDTFMLPCNIKTMRIHPILPIIAMVGDNSQLSIYNIEKRCNMNNITPSIFQPSIYQFLELRHRHDQPEENQMKMFSEVFDTISIYNNKKYGNTPQDDVQNSIENGYYANLVENEITGTECQICQGIYQANKFVTKFNWLPDYDLYNKSCTEAYKQYKDQSIEPKDYLDFFTQDLKFSQFDNQIHHRYVNTKIYNKDDQNASSIDILQDQLNGNYIQFLNKSNNYPLVGVSYQHNIDGSCYYQLFNNIYEPGGSRLVSSFKLFEREREYPVELVNPLYGMWSLDSYRRVLNYNFISNVSNHYEWQKKIQNQQHYLENSIRHILYDLKGFELNIQPHKKSMIRESKFISNLDSDKQVQNKIVFARGKEIKLIDLYQERMILHKKAEQFDNDNIQAINSMCLNKDLLSLCDVAGNVKIYDLRSNKEIISHKFDIPVTKVFVESSSVINCFLQNGSIIRKQNHESLITVPGVQDQQNASVSGFVKKNIGGYALGQQGIVNIFDLNTTVKTDVPSKSKSITIDPFENIEFRQDGMMFCVWKNGNIRIYSANQ